MGRPYILELNRGERKALCTCDMTKNTPFCDGSHKGSGCTPLVIHFVDENKVTVSGTSCGTQEKTESHTHGGGCCHDLPKSKLTELEPSEVPRHGCCRDLPTSTPPKDEEGGRGCCRH